MSNRHDTVVYHSVDHATTIHAGHVTVDIIIEGTPVPKEIGSVDAVLSASIPRDLVESIMKAHEKKNPTAELNDAEIDEALKSSDEPIAKFFSYSHLPPHLASVSRGFAIMAVSMLKLPRNAERSAGLRKLIEAKDCAVRAAIAK